MPPNTVSLLSSSSSIVNYPFKLTATTVQSYQIPTAASKDKQDCQCPCGVTTNTNITSSLLFTDLQTAQQKAAQIAAQKVLFKSPGKSKKGVIVARESYLFKSILPSARPFYTDATINDYGTHDLDPIIRVYGLDQPIITEDFLVDEDPATSLATVKIWLSVCFPSGEPASSWTNLFESCAKFAKNDVETNVARADWRSLKPLVAFISFGRDYPTPLIVTRTIDKQLGTQTPPSPRIERRTVEAHVPIGEVDVHGRVVQQYVRTHLFLQDMCANGSPAKIPVPVFNNY